VLSTRFSVRHAALFAVLGAVLGLGHMGARASSARTISFPSPPPNATVYSRQFGNQALALAVAPQLGAKVLVQASVIGMQGNGVRGLRIGLTVAGRTRIASACGAGCYRASFAARSPKAVDVSVARTRWHVALPAEWPPREATSLVNRAGTVWRSLHSVSFHETLGSGTGHVTVSDWRIQAPDRLAYQVVGGWAGVVIGGRRWDRAPGTSKWQASAQTRLHQPVPFWVSVTDAHVLGNVTYAGRPAVRLSFFDPGSHAWFTLVLDRETLRTRDSRMITNAHFMHDTYRAFDSTPAIVRPR
jgi:hypothetical protein